MASLRFAREMVLLLILGLSARFTGGGLGFVAASWTSLTSLLNSPDLRGGGGEGGREEDTLGGLPDSTRGVLGLLGSLKCLGDAPPEEADRGESVVRYAGVFGSTRLNWLPFGGDWGGWIVTAGIIAVKGRGRALLVGEGDKCAEVLR